MFVFQFVQETQQKPQLNRSFPEVKQAAEQSVVKTATQLENLKIPLPTIPKISEATTSDQVNRLMTTFYAAVQQQIQKQMESHPENIAAYESLLAFRKAQALELNNNDKDRQKEHSDNKDKYESGKLNKEQYELAEKNTDLKYDDRERQIYSAKSVEELYNLAKAWGHNDLQNQVNDFVSGLIQRIKETIARNSLSLMALTPQLTRINNANLSQGKKVSYAVSEAMSEFRKKSPVSTELKNEEKAAKTLKALAEEVERKKLWAATLSASLVKQGFEIKNDIVMSEGKPVNMLENGGGHGLASLKLSELSSSSYQLAVQIASNRLETENAGVKSTVSLPEGGNSLRETLYNALVPQSDLGKIRFVKTPGVQ